MRLHPAVTFQGREREREPPRAEPHWGPSGACVEEAAKLLHKVPTERNLGQMLQLFGGSATDKPQPRTPHPDCRCHHHSALLLPSADSWTNSDYHLNSWKGPSLFPKQLMGVGMHKYVCLFTQQTFISASFMLHLVLSAGDAEMPFIRINPEIYGLPCKDV